MYVVNGIAQLLHP